MKKNVLLLETIAEEAFQLLEENTQVFPAYGSRKIDAIVEENAIHAVITRGKGQVNLQLMEACPHLQVAARCGVGLDNVDVKEASRRNIKVINAPGSNAGTIAEHAMALMLMLIRNMYTAATKVKEGNWEWRNQFEGDELNGKTLGILGLGNIGRRVARLGDAFGMKVIYWDKFNVAADYEAMTFSEVLKKSDIISLHLPLLEDTFRLIGEEELSLMKPSAYLINTARGGIIDQNALVKALDEGKIAGFGADVLAEEPPEKNDPLLSHPKSIITAHVGSLTATTYKNMCLSTVKNVLAVLSGDEPEPQSIFNKKALGIKS